MPKSDDWVVFMREEYRSLPTWNSLTWAYNEHRYILVRAIHWMYTALNLNSFPLFLSVNYFTFCAMLLLVGVLLFKDAREKVFVFFIPFFFSTVLWDNHTWALLLAIHLTYFFFICAVYSFYRYDDQPKKQSILICLFLFLSLVADSNGVPLSVGFACLWALYYLKSNPRKRLNTRYFVLAMTVIFTPVLWYVGTYTQPDIAPKIVNPFHLGSIQYFLKLCSRVFGYENSSILLGLFSAGLLIFPVLYSAVKYLRSREISLFRYTLILAMVPMLLTLLSVAMARGADWERLNGYIFPRYYLFGLLLLPFCVQLWYGVLGEFEKLKWVKTVFVCVLLVFTVRGFYSDWNFDIYRTSMHAKKSLLDCIQLKVEKKEEIICAHINEENGQPVLVEDFGPHMIEAQKLGFSFAQGMDLSYLKKLKEKSP